MHPIERDDYVLPTVAIEKFVNVCLSWIRSNVVGALVPGLQRIGKTYAIAYFVANCERWLLGTVGVISVEVGYHKSITEALFFGDFLKSMKRPTTKRKPEERRDLFVGYLVEAASRSKARKVVVFVDEAQLLDDHLFKLLISVHNELWKVYEIKAVWMLVGQPELEAFVTTYVAQGSRQIVGRFMTDVYHFEPLSGIENVEATLSCYDEYLKHPANGPTYTECYAPDAYAAGYRLRQDAVLLCSRLDIAREAANLPTSAGMTMQGFTTLMNHIIVNVLPALRPGEHLTPELIDEAIETTNCMIYERQEAIIAAPAPASESE